jgi:hypothetical protein
MNKNYRPEFEFRPFQKIELQLKNTAQIFLSPFYLLHKQMFFPKTAKE